MIFKRDQNYAFIKLSSKEILYVLLYKNVINNLTICYKIENKSISCIPIGDEKFEASR